VALSHVDGGLTLHWDLGRESSPSRDLERAAASVENEFAGTGYRAAGQVLLSAGGREQVVRGSALELKVRGSRLKASPGTFYQVNPWVNEVLVERVLDRLRMHGVRNLLDLFCGNGNFSVPAARAGIEIDGVDSSLTGIKDAMVVAGDNCRFHALDAGRFLDEKSGRWNAVLVDPPRAGLTNHVAGRLIALKAGTLVYVSCEPATLARDLALLVKGGYSIRNVELFDMFPQTSHAEVMVEMEGTR
jgi:23S rRNA (uracil1939-C5)-methyltransferase